MSIKPVPTMIVSSLGIVERLVLGPKHSEVCITEDAEAGIILHHVILLYNNDAKLLRLGQHVKIHIELR